LKFSRNILLNLGLIPICLFPSTLFAHLSYFSENENSKIFYQFQDDCISRNNELTTKKRLPRNTSLAIACGMIAEKMIDQIIEEKINSVSLVNLEKSSTNNYPRITNLENDLRESQELFNKWVSRECKNQIKYIGSPMKGRCSFYLKRNRLIQIERITSNNLFKLKVKEGDESKCDSRCEYDNRIKDMFPKTSIYRQMEK
tara:strand:- start:2127 stop:2726 length:600 start_codon:yes stop_codon:yes gene_type:complete